MFYQGCALAILVSASQMMISRFKVRLAWSASLKDSLITLLATYAFLFTIPVTADRSYSVKMLHYIGEASDGVSREDVNRHYLSELIYRGGIEKRFSEQQATGTIVQRDGVYVLTAKGRVLDSMFCWTCRLFVCQR